MDNNINTKHTSNVRDINIEYLQYTSQAAEHNARHTRRFKNVQEIYAVFTEQSTVQYILLTQ